MLRASAATVSEGMLANTADTGSLEYNTVDGTLWFVHAIGRHVSVTGDDDLGDELAPVVDEIVQHHVDGTRFGIGVDPADGLLRQGAEGWALTWMDARIDGVPVTPRAGKPVEVNALWIRALEIAAGWRRARTRGSAGRRSPTRRAASFVARFVRPDGARALRRGRRARGRRRCRPAEPAARGVAPGRTARRRRRGGAARRSHVRRAELLTPLGLRSLVPGRPRLPARTTAAGRPNATPPTTRAPSGRG